MRLSETTVSILLLFTEAGDFGGSRDGARGGGAKGGYADDFKGVAAEIFDESDCPVPVMPFLMLLVLQALTMFTL